MAANKADAVAAAAEKHSEEEKPQQTSPETPKHRAGGKVLSTRKLEKFLKKQNSMGVVYISRVPPFMKPAKLRHLLSQHGEINRLYLVPEDPATRKRRRKKGGNKRLKYTEGWIEFVNKKDAKEVASVLNNTLVGGKSRFFRDDIWNLRYLKGFKWSHLMEKFTYERRIREKRLAIQMKQAKKEKAMFSEKVELARKIERKARKRMLEAKEGDEVSGADKFRKRQFRQRKVTSSKLVSE